MRRAALLLAILAAGCNGGGGGDGGASGRVEVEIVVPADPAADPFLGVERYKVTVRSGVLVVTTGWFGASDALEIADITPGTGYTVGLEAYVGPGRVARGRTMPFDFVEGQTSTARMYFARIATFNPVRNPSGAPARSGASAMRFSDGTVLVAGGLVGGTAVATADLYFPDTDRILPAGGTMAAAHAYAVTVDLGGDRVLVAGGIDAADNATAAADVFEYTPATTAGVWISGVPSMGTPRREAAGAKLADNVAFVAGGETVVDNPLDSTEVFSYVAGPGSWSSAPVMADPRRGAAAFEIAAGKVIVAGGFNASGGGPNDYNNSTDLYTWNGTNAVRTSTGNLASRRERFGIAPLGAFSWVLFGGQDDGGLVNDVESITPNGSATNINTSNETNLSNSVRRGGGVRLADGRILFIGGDSGTGATINPVNRLLEFDPATGDTAPVTPTVGATGAAVGFELGDGTSVVVIDDQVLRYSPDAP